MGSTPQIDCHFQLTEQARIPKILFAVDELQALTAGGTERQILQLVDFAKRAGFAPHLLVLRGTEWLDEKQAGCPIHRARFNGIGLTGLLRLGDVVRWMRDERFQIVQTFFVETNLIVPLLAHLAGVPIILGSRRNLNSWMSRRFAWLQHQSNRACHRLLANSQAVRDAVAQSERISPDKIDVLYNGVDTAKFMPRARQRELMRARLDIAHGQIVVCCASNLAPFKGVDVLAKAARQAVKEVPELLFLVLGDGPLRAPIQQLAESLDLDGHWRMLGSQTDVAAYLNVADIAILPSESEGFSNTLLEAMASGLPCIATEVGGNREAVGDVGELVPPSDPQALAAAIVKLCREPERRAALGRAACQRACEMFSYERAAAAFAVYYVDRLRETNSDVATKPPVEQAGHCQASF